MATKSKGIAFEGSPKYDEQVWAGLVEDPRRYAELQQARVPAKLGPMGQAPGAGVTGGSAGTATTASEVQAP